ncbi:BlaI/MecI/CopY family transcriptional regulator [Anaerocolumna sp. MB42-C2]|uniref:BlaI/MecI/CopY family transcriptional regulator n=1 Tax=Anaerocolumna sp. MB42-C2 TaxID=3070997 RepID=UPI0027E0F944|nr:BlaI/MecI/CopY family transcriptional regulator [Anaerocolumna sp. MB42-C2]WMJ86079.1 BlaI/MecI/CopY family transcriptional regulator [Anaerocolumna sp. MB42-C2]
MNKISDSEWKVMKVVWKKSPISGSEIVDELEAVTGWNPKTIHTLIRRLVAKGAINAKKENTYYSYYAAVSEKECVKEETENFLEKCFNGSLNMLVGNFIKEDKLTDQDIEELQEILKSNKRR